MAETVTVTETVTGARFAAATTRYGHGVLGDAVEWGALVIETGSGSRRITLARTHVFEDIAPRLWDVTGDGAPEVVVVQTDMRRGAALAVYGPAGKLAATPPIGTPFRWLAPVGAADMDGDGLVEIALVDRPHLRRVLQVWEFREGVLHLEAEAQGLTNHRIGENAIAGGMRDCGTGPEAVTVDAGWTRVMATRLVDGRAVSRSLGPWRGPDDMRRALACGI